MSETVRAVKLIISGKVQGVWYRASAKNEADKLGITGWVMNLKNGSVEAFAEGDPGLIEEFIAWCWEGPTFAKVSNVEVVEMTPEGGEEFRVRR